VGTKLIEERQRGTRVRDLTDQHKAFVVELLADDMFDGARAARKAGYRAPQQAAYRLLKLPKIQAALGKAQRLRMERVGLSADKLLEYIDRVIFFNPLKYFVPGPEGWTVEDADDLPEWVGEMIESIESKQRVLPDGEVQSYLKVSMLSKAVALKLAMAHCGLDKPRDEGRTQDARYIDWDDMLTPTLLDGDDPISQEIREVENLAERK
jgi:hypothetical protein